MKNILTALFLSCAAVLAQAPGEANPPPPEFSPAAQLDQHQAEALRHALREQTAAGAPPAGTPAPTRTNRPVLPAFPAFPQPGPRPVPRELPTNSIAVPSHPAAPTNGIVAPSHPVAPTNAPGEALIEIKPPATAATAPPEETLPAGTINFPATDVNQVLQIYAELVNRTVLRPTQLSSQPITLRTQTPLTKREAIQAFDAVLALNGIAMINVDEKFVKAVPVAQANQEGAPFSKLTVSQLPDLGSYVTHVVQLKYARPSELVQALQPFAKIPNSILPIDSSQILVLRDYTENVKRMLEMVKEIDVAVPSEFISEVIPIKYALAGDIANALNSLSAGGGGTTVGSSAGGMSRGGFGGQMGTGGMGNTGGMGSRFGAGSSSFNRPGFQQGTTPFGGATGAFGTQAGAQPGAVGGSFTERLQNIIRRASASGEIQVIGQTKIIADERTNSLLIFATREDMTMIKDIIAKLDVVLAQVLIESVIMEVSLDDSRSVGFSYLEKKSHGGNYATGIGAIKNGSFLTPNSFSALTNMGGSVPGGFSYLASFGSDLDVTMTAVAGDGRVNVLSRPRIQTSHAVPCNLFIGNTVPYIQGTTFGDFAGISSRSVYQEKSVGISLAVLPLINPDGLVVMDIQQDIEQLGTPVTIDGNPVPTTTKRSANAKVAVKDRDTVMLGGIISNSKTITRSGVPILKDVPLLGFFFRSSSDANQRAELIVLLRPTVLPTPEAAASVAAAERNNLGGVKRAEAEFRSEEAKRLRQADREAEKLNK